MLHGYVRFNHEIVKSRKHWKKYYFFSKVNGDLSNPFRELSNGMKFEVCCFDLYVKCVLLLTRTKHVPLFFL